MGSESSRTSRRDRSSSSRPRSTPSPDSLESSKISQQDGKHSEELQTLLRSSLESQTLPDNAVAEYAVEGDGVQLGSRAKKVHTSYIAVEEKAIVRKFDTRLVLFMCLLYMLSFLDRSNIGNARIAGLETSLSLRPGQYAWLLTAFYITYISFEWMALLYRVIPAHIYISLCVFSWGLIASLQSVARSFTSLVIFRAMLGVAEAAFGPGVPFYLSFFYKRSELAYRVGLFISAAPLATSFASSLAWLIVKAFQNSSIDPWRALFLIEGFPSLVVAGFAWFIIPDSPATATYLTPRQREIATLRLQPEDHSTLSTTKTTTSTSTSTSAQHKPKKPPHHLSLHDLVQTLLDPKSYLTSLMFFSANVSFSSLPVFLPTILSSSNLTALQSQLLSSPPYLISFPFLLYISHLSDRVPNSRAYFLILTSLLSSLSYATLALAGHYHDQLGTTATFILRYTAVHGACMGFFTSVTLIITWTINNQSTATGKGTGIALLNVVGQCGPLLGTRLYPDRHKPFFVPGMLVCAGFMAAVAGLAAGLRWWLASLNGSLELEDLRLRGGDNSGMEMEMEMDRFGASDDDDDDDDGDETEREAVNQGIEDGLMGTSSGGGRGPRAESRSHERDVFRYML